MTKKIIAILTLIFVALMAFTGCAGDQYVSVPISGAQDTSYTVLSNGGSAVQYGNYVYFLNGTRGYEDTEGEANLFGQVVKGAVYRAELIGEKQSDGTFLVKRDSVTNLTLKSSVKENYKGDEENVVSVQAVAPKTVGTSGYGEGGIYILDDCMFYASPNNLKNKSGEVQYLKTDFFRMTLDGKTTQKIYTTENDSATAPYTFIMNGNFVYLVVLDGTDLISVKINKNNGKIEDTIKIAEEVTEAVLPTKPVYYDGVSENTIYDFVYIKRAAKDTDTIRSGEILEFMRPDGSSRYIFEAGNTYTLETVRDGYFFYRKAVNYENQLVASNLHTALSAHDTKYKNDAYNQEIENIERVVYPSASSALDSLSVYPFVSGYEFDSPKRGNGVSVLTYTATTDSSATVNLSLYVDGTYKGQIASGAGLTLEGKDGSVVYYANGGTLYAVDLGEGYDFNAKEIATGFTSGVFGVDVAGGFLIYFGKEGEANDYAHFYELDGVEGTAYNPLFVGAYATGEEPSVIESITVTTTPDVTTYEKGDELDLTGLEVTATYYKDSEGNRPEDEKITVTSDMISGFDSSVTGEQTVTVTYKKRTATFTVTVNESTDSASCATVAPVDPWFFIGGGLIIAFVAGALFIGKKKATVA